MLRQQHTSVAAGGGASQCIATKRIRFPSTSRHFGSRYTKDARNVLNAFNWNSIPVLPKNARDVLNALNRNPVPVLPQINSVEDLTSALERDPALRTLFDTLADIFEVETVLLHYTPAQGPEVCVEVLRGDLLSASNSLQSMCQFLKQELTIRRASDIAVSWRDAAVPGGRQHLISGPKYLNAFPLPFIVGKASDWYVAEASTATAEKQAS